MPSSRPQAPPHAIFISCHLHHLLLVGGLVLTVLSLVESGDLQLAQLAHEEAVLVIGGVAALGEGGADQRELEDEEWEHRKPVAHLEVVERRPNEGVGA